MEERLCDSVHCLHFAVSYCLGRGGGGGGEGGEGGGGGIDNCIG